MPSLIQFAFILSIPLVLMGGGIATLFAVAAVLEALENPEALKQRISEAFRRPPKPAKAPPVGHYYRRYWQS